MFIRRGSTCRDGWTSGGRATRFGASGGERARYLLFFPGQTTVAQRRSLDEHFATSKHKRKKSQRLQKKKNLKRFHIVMDTDR